jgi:AAA domain-containing protein/DnaB helicase-like protein
VLRAGGLTVQRRAPAEGQLSNTRVEAAFLGCAIRRPADLALVVREDFTDPRHVTIFDALTAMVAEGEPVTPLTLGERLRHIAPTFERAYVFVVAEDEYAVTPTPLARILKDCTRRRHLDSIWKLLQRDVEDSAVEPVEAAQRAINALTATTEPLASTYFADDAEIETEPVLTPLVEGWLTLGEIALLVADKGVGKTFVALDLAFSIATGRPWHGHAVRQGGGVYIVAEGHAGLGQRVRAWKAAYGVADRIGVRFRRMAVNLLDERAVAALLGALRCLPEPPVLIVIDTLNRCILGGSENDSRDMGLAVAALERIRAATNGTVLVLHHVGHQEKGRARGHSSLEAAVDTVLMLTRDERTRALTLTDTKQRDDTTGHELALDLRSVPVGARTSCVVERIEVRARSEYLSNGAFAALRELVRAGSGLTFTTWHKATKASKSTFTDQRKLLADRGFVEERDGLYWPTEKGASKIEGPEVRPRYEQSVSDLSVRAGTAGPPPLVGGGPPARTSDLLGLPSTDGRGPNE